MAADIDERCLLSAAMIRNEYARTHPGENSAALDAGGFSVEDRALSLDDFSRKFGWIDPGCCDDELIPGAP